MGKIGTKGPKWTDQLNNMQRLCESWNAKYAKYPLIGFGYRSFVGRTTAAYASEATARFAFADQIRQVAYRFNPYIESAGLRLEEGIDNEGWENMKTVEEVRLFLQKLGSSSAWIRPVLTQAIMMIKAGHPVVITDVRIPDEATTIKRAGGILVKINRPYYDPVLDDPYYDPVLDDPYILVPEHPSEHALDDWDDWDLVIDNDGTLEEFRQKCKALFVVK